MIDQRVYHGVKLPQLLLLSLNLLQLVLEPLRQTTVLDTSPYPDPPTVKLSILNLLTVSDSFILMVILLTASDALLIILRNPAPLRV